MTSLVAAPMASSVATLALADALAACGHAIRAFPEMCWPGTIRAGRAALWPA